ncbi:MAG: hypothetical protein M3066_16650 [Actinomycetota bacterium]|nr:hypothetical protein [Actinomycetota bacterium]
MAMAIATLVALAPPASAASTISVSPSSVAQGGTVTVSGNVPVAGAASCASGAAAQLTSTAALFPPAGFGPQAARDSSGGFSVAYTVPASTPVGSYDIGIRCAGGNVGVTATLRVTAPSTVTPGVAVSPASAAAGDRVTVSGTVPVTGAKACPSVDAVELTSTAALFPPSGFGPQATRDATGHFSVGYTIPSGTAPGAYSVGVRCGGGNVGVSAALQVTRPVSTTPPTTTAVTTTAVTTTTTAVTTTTTVVPTSVPPTATPPRAGGASRTALWIVLGLVVLLAVAGASWLVVRRRREGPPVV